jgi:peptidoglycan/LPS O-acetylase OafA/YrhL
LITSLLLAESARSGSVGLGGFWARRARRLLPALVVLMVGVAVYSVVLAKPSELGQIRGDAFSTLFYVANWHQIFAHQSYFALFSAPSPLNHTWSLAIEEQFYVVWPLVFVGLLARFGRATPKAVLATALVFAGVSSVLMVVLYDPVNSNRVYFGTDTRAAAILFGVALAAARAIDWPAIGRGSRRMLEAVGLGGVMVLVVAWTRLDGQSSTLYRGGFLVCGLAATAVIAAAVHPDRGPVAWVLSFKPLCALGLISYGVYLYHWPIDVALDGPRTHIHGWPLFALQTAVTLTIATLSYRLIEQPVRRGNVTTTQLRRFTPAIAITLTAALLITTNGARTTGAAASTPNSANLQALAAVLAMKSAQPGSRRIMLVGNSVAFDLLRPFRDVRSDPPVAVYGAGVAACAFPPQITATYRNPATNQQFKAVPCHPSWEVSSLKIFRPAVVFWLMSDAPEPWRYGDRPVRPCAEPYNSIYVRGLRSEVARLETTGATVVITTQAYVRYVVAGGGFGARALSDRAVDCNNRLRREVASETGARLVDLFAYVCPHGACRTEQNGVVLRPDGLHYEGRGGEIVARWLLDQVK